MTIRMATLTRTSSGLWTSRKVIPADVRESFGKREDKPTWPASLTAAQARSEFLGWLSDLEARIERLRLAPTAKAPVQLSERQVRALAGHWYRELLAEYGDNPGSAEGWEVARDDLIPETNEEGWRRGVLGLDVGEEPTLQPSAYVRRSHVGLIEAERLQLDERSTEALLEQMTDMYWRFCSVMIERAGGDFRKDAFAETLPEWSPVPAEEARALSADAIVPLSGLFDAYVAERQPAPATVKAWSRFIKHFIAYVGYDDAARIQPLDVVGWKDALLAEKRPDGSQKSAKTVRETYLAALRTVLQNGLDNRRVQTNPAAGVKVRGPKPQRLRDRGFTDAEAQMVLKATLEAAPERLAEGNRLARRWIPWICAYSGARVNEITQLRGEDVFEEDGVHVLRITPEAGSVKTNEARLVPLHSHLIDQGFLEVVEAKGKGAIFYDPKQHRGGTEGNPQYKKVGERLARWVREIGIDDSNVPPNHAWRHRFKTVARQARMDPEARERIPGHTPSNEGERYGGWAVAALKEEIEKLPRYEV